MKVSGTATVNAPVERVWVALNDPDVLVRTIPGCEQLEVVAPDRYRMRVTAGVASIKGSYVGDVELADLDPPGAFTLRVSGSGAPGTVSADVKVRLEDAGEGTTTLRYDADAVVGGAVGGVGQRVLAGVAKKTAGEFFKAVDDVLAGVATAPDMAPLPAAASVPAAGTGPPPTVFTRPRSEPSRAREARVDVLSQLGAALVGAAIALVGVAVGWRIARRNLER